MRGLGLEKDPRGMGIFILYSGWMVPVMPSCGRVILSFVFQSTYEKFLSMVILLVLIDIK
jgi:hypothetical protein